MARVTEAATLLYPRRRAGAAFSETDPGAEAEFVSEEFVARLRAVLPRIRRIDAAYLDHLQRMRFSWLSGNVAQWRSHADEVASMAGELEAILKSAVQP